MINNNNINVLISKFNYDGIVSTQQFLAIIAHTHRDLVTSDLIKILIISFY